MVEKIGHVRNPLSVIAIFAGIAEISGTIVLPFIQADNQAIYIWFLMLFPFFLVGVFFWTLHKNPAALYSPSDYKDESHFANLIRKATPEELSFKLSQEVKEVESDIEKVQPESTASAESTADARQSASTAAAASAAAVVAAAAAGGGAVAGGAAGNTVVDGETVDAPAPAPATSASSSPGVEADGEPNPAWWYKEIRMHQKNTHRLMGELALAQKLAITRLTNKLGVPLQTGIHIDVKNGTSLAFDAFGVSDSVAHAVEVKLFPTATIEVERFHKAVQRAAKTEAQLKGKGLIKELVLHLFIISTADRTEIYNATAALYAYSYSLGVKVSVHSTTMSDLAEDLTTAL